MGKATGFLEYERTTAPRRPVAERGGRLLPRGFWFPQRGENFGGEKTMAGLVEMNAVVGHFRVPFVRRQIEVAQAPLFRERVGIMVGRELGALPAIGDRHLTEFLPTFLQGEENVARYGLVRTSIADRAENYARKRASIGRILSGEERDEDFLVSLLDEIVVYDRARVGVFLRDFGQVAFSADGDGVWRRR